MVWGTVFQGIGAFAGLLTAGGGLLLAIKVIMPTHKIVNQEKTDRDNFNRALVRALNDAGIKVPIDQSLPTDERNERDEAGPT